MAKFVPAWSESGCAAKQDGMHDPAGKQCEETGNDKRAREHSNHGINLGSGVVHDVFFAVFFCGLLTSRINGMAAAETSVYRPKALR